MFSRDVERALRVSFAAHAGQVRKSLEPVPYATHPFHVALLLARLGHDDVVLQAALLHDVVEDCEGWTLERVEREFGPAVRAIVAELTEDKTQSWEARKRAAVDHVGGMSPGALAVKAADKLHNLRTLVDDLAASADRARVWSRFNGGRERTSARSAELVAALERRVEPRLGNALRATLAELAGFAREDVGEAG
jgi:(p)ppGpp synthase/HD superfamily hydrolase